MRKRERPRDGERRWRQWTEEEAREVFAELAASGETAAAFSRRTGISHGRLAYWRKRVAPRERTDFVAVDLAGVAMPRCLEIVAAGVVVRMREDLDADQVARLVFAIGRRASGGC